MNTTTRMPAQSEVPSSPNMTSDVTGPGSARLAAAVRDALRAAPYVPVDDVDIEVRDHAVHLSGTVKWEHQRVAAERAVEHLTDVHVLENSIRVLPRISATEVGARIVEALHYGRSAADHRIDVDVDDASVTLTGAVESYADRQLAQRTALTVPHVRSVRNLLQIVRT